MPKIIDYPRASLKASLALAQAVDDLGGSCTGEMAADKMGKKRGGAFQALVGATVKYGLVEHRKGRLNITGRFRDYKLSYNKEEQDQVGQQAFLSVPVFQRIYERFRQHKLPVEHFEKLLIREFDVDEAMASRVGMYFIEGAKLVGLLKADNTFGAAPPDLEPSDAASEASDDEPTSRDIVDAPLAKGPTDESRRDGIYSVRISGPGIDSVVSITEEDDLEIVQTMLRKVRKQLSVTSASSAPTIEKDGN